MDQALTVPGPVPGVVPVSAKKPQTVSLIVENMTCAACIGRIERALARHTGRCVGAGQPCRQARLSDL